MIQAPPGPKLLAPPGPRLLAPPIGSNFEIGAMKCGLTYRAITALMPTKTPRVVAMAGSTRLKIEPTSALSMAGITG